MSKKRNKEDLDECQESFPDTQRINLNVSHLPHEEKTGIKQLFFFVFHLALL